ncbi:MAG: hypothetical protein VKJ24_21175 [Synechococcales bacterium]|nr:hypothetical protein [Synechococcales bacterium]
MQQITVELPDDLALRLGPLRSQLPQILERGLVAWSDEGSTVFSGLSEVLEFLAKLPTPEEVLALRPSDTLSAKITELLEKNRAEGLTEAEEQLWQQYERVEYLVQMAKAQALLKLKKAV